MNLFTRQFAFDLPALVNFVGGGGKTLLILTLMEEYSHQTPVIYTTTTRIHPPHPDGGLAIITCDDLHLLALLADKAVRDSCSRVRKFVVTRNFFQPDFLRGVEPDFATSLDRKVCNVILNEADGARSMSLKMPLETEPVLMDNADYLVPVIGIDCLMKPLGPDTLFRWETASTRFSLEEGRVLTPEVAGGLLMHPQGVCKHWKPGTRIIPYINKADGAELDPLAEKLARVLLQNENFPVERVVWGSLSHDRAASLPGHG